MTRPWNIAATEVQHASLREALTDCKGNITAAAVQLGLARSHVTRLIKKYALTEFAAELRLDAGMVVARGDRKGVVTGRPRK